MVRTQIALEERQINALKELSVSEGHSMAELIRRCVDTYLRTRASDNGSIDKKRRALAAVGRFRSNVTDLAVEHDRYLSEAFSE